MTATTEGPAEAPELGITPADLSHEIGSFVRRQERRRRLAPRASLVGLIAGLVAVAFRRSLEGAEWLRASLLKFAHLHGTVGFVVLLLVSALAAGLAQVMVQRLAPEAAGSGIPHLKAVLHRLRGMRWRRVLPVKFGSGLLAIGSGLALGREGPTVQMGGAVGQMCSRWLRVNPRERQALVAAGAGAGLAAAFNAPLAGVLFVLEELQGDFAPGVLTASFVASITADLVTRFLFGQEPQFHVGDIAAPALSSLPLFLLLGLICGLLGVAFNRALLGSLNLFARTGNWPRGTAAAAVGLMIGMIGWFQPDSLGGGAPLVKHALAGDFGLAALAGLLALRFAMTMASYGCGTAGGIFAPLLVIGAQAGLLAGLLSPPWLTAGAHSEALAVVGMASLFTAVVRAPLTGIVLLLEMTANYGFMLPLLAASFTAYGIANLLGDEPIYEALLERDTLRSQDSPELEGTLMVDHKILPGAPFDGRRIADLGLPAGCLIVAVRRGLRTTVPHRETLLKSGDHISAVVAPEAAAAISLLWTGTQG
jgi:CIC family chloride channel protein